MTHRPCRIVALAAFALLLPAVPAGSAPAGNPGNPGDSNPDAAQALAKEKADQFLAARPGTKLLWDQDRVSRVYGKAFSNGASPQASAEQFRVANSAMLGVEPADLRPGGPSGRNTQQLMFDPATGQYKFTAVYYSHVVAGIPVYGSHLTLLVRNQPNFPGVLAVNSLKPLGGFAINQPAAIDARAAGRAAAAVMPGMHQVGPVRTVIWAETNPARLAYQIVAEIGTPALATYQKELLTFDAANNALLGRENLVLEGGGGGNVSGRGSPGLLPDIPQNLPVLRPLAGAIVETSQVSTFAAGDGSFFLSKLFASDVVSSHLVGAWTEIIPEQGVALVQTATFDGHSPVLLVFNQPPAEFNTAQVNAFIQTKIVHDFAGSVNPDYPGLEESLPVNVNIDLVCNASFSGDALNFRNAGVTIDDVPCPNTAYSTVVYHEFGHFLIDRAGTVQGAYGEGMADCIAIILTDQPWIGDAWHMVPGQPLRDQSDNGITFPCTGEIHLCGGVIAGSVWDLREQLHASHPGTYLSIVRNLTLNSILLNPPGLNPGLVIDFLTLDDDNDNLVDGTPHFNEINAAFTIHGLPPPYVTFTFPDGIPQQLNPAGGPTIRVNVEGVTTTPTRNSGRLHIDPFGAGFVEVTMTQTSPNQYQVTFPPSECFRQVPFFFSTSTSIGDPALSPSAGPDEPYEALSAAFITPIFTDDFEDDLGWTVQDSPSLDAGSWERGVPAGDGDRGDPIVDADGSGQCFLTGNEAGDSDVDGGQTFLISPIMDATAVHPMLSYYRWFSNDLGSSPGTEVFKVEVSADSGAHWVTLETVGPTGPGTHGGWFFKEFRIADFVAVTNHFRVRFTASDLPPAGSIIEAAVDGVRIGAVGCVAIAGDLDANGIVDSIDLGALLSSWSIPATAPGCGGSLPCAADLNGDGHVNSLDLGILLAHWTL